MKKIKYKKLKYQNILIKCVEGIQDSFLQQNVYGNIENFQMISDEYKNLAEKQELHNSIQGVINNFSYENMIFLYGKLRDSTHSRTYYDKIISSSSICPYCGVGTSSSLDHYLPKKYYSMYSIDPYNLLPCCSDCNRKKGEYKQLFGEQTLHPYFDNFSNERLIFMTVKEHEGNIAFGFELKTPFDLSHQEYTKYSIHFDVLKLEKLYITQAASELHSQIHNLKKLHAKGGKVAVFENLTDIYETNFLAEVNSWKTAMYDGLRNSEWFCDTGLFIFEYELYVEEVEEELLSIPKKDS